MSYDYVPISSYRQMPKMNDNAKDRQTTCPDCGLVVFSTAETMCPRCGAMLSGEEPGHALLTPSEYPTPLDQKCQRLRDGVANGEKLRSELDDFIAEVKRDADDGDDEAQEFLARRFYDERVDPEIVFRLRTAAAKQGNHRAEMDLGVMYEYGIGVERDVFAALRLYRRSARRGNPQAMLNLGTLFDRGVGVKQDKAKAIACYEKCHAAGHLKGTVFLASLYLDGGNLPENNEKALHYFRIAAEEGDNFARIQIFRMYKGGRQCSLGAVEAMTCCRMAAESGDSDGMQELAVCFSDGFLVKQDEAEASRWLEKAVSLGVPSAMLSMSMRYNLGIGCERNPERAFYLAGKAVEQGLNAALWQLSRCYRHGIGCQVNEELAEKYLIRALDSGDEFAWRANKPETAAKEFDSRMRWAGDDTGKLLYIYRWANASGFQGCARALEKAVELGDTWAMCRLGICHSQGWHGIEKNFETAVACYRKSADAGDPWGMEYLALSYYRGEGVAKDLGLAEKYMRKAVELGNPEAQYFLSVMLGNGTCAVQDAAESLKYLKLAAEAGCGKALRDLGWKTITGDGVEKNVDVGVDMLERAGNLGDPSAWWTLAHLFADGDFHAKDCVRAHEYMCRGAAAGEIDAILDLARMAYNGIGCPQDRERAYQIAKRASDMGSEAGAALMADIEAATPVQPAAPVPGAEGPKAAPENEQAQDGKTGCPFPMIFVFAAVVLLVKLLSCYLKGG